MRAAVAAVAVLLTGHALGAQAPARRHVATLAFDQGVIAVDAWSDGHLLVGASTERGTVTVTLRAAAVREFADSTDRLAARHVAAARTERVLRSVVTDPASGAGISVARHVLGRRSTYRLFFAGGGLAGFPMEVSARDLHLLTRALRRAAATARTMGEPPKASRTKADSAR